MTSPLRASAPPEALSIAAASLLQGVVYAEEDARTWTAIGTHLPALRDHFRVLGLRVIVDDAERFAYLRTEEELPEGMPRLQRRHTLSKHATVLAILLRQRLQQSDSAGDIARVVLSAEELVEMMRLYYAEGTTEDRVLGSVRTLINLGFLRKLSGDNGFEVRRIVKAVITAEWIATFGQQLIAEIEGDSPDPAAGSDGVDPGASTVESDEPGVGGVDDGLADGEFADDASDDVELEGPSDVLDGTRS